jgi:RND family efflux transporter MFP subunit
MLIFSLVLSGCGPKPATNQDGEPIVIEELEKEVFYVKSEEVSLQSFTNELTFPGKAEPVQTVVITAKTSGDVESASYDIGDPVEKNTVLMTLDDENHRIAASSAQLGLNNASITLQTSKDDLARNKALFESGAISKTTMDAVENGYKKASIGYKTAKNAYDTAKINLNNTKIQTPISGIISSKNFDIGENINPGTPVYTVVNTSQINVVVGIPEQYVQGIATSQEATLTSPYSDHTWTGKIINISPVMNEQSKTYTTKILVDNADMSMKSGMSLDVTITVDTTVERPAFNKLGLILEDEDTYVYVNNNGKAKMVAVKIGQSNDDYYEVIEGLKLGDEVITEGSGMLDTGDIIEVNN